MNNNNEITFTGKERGKITWTSPSNIALVKYWGKRGPQLPANPSVSMTLNKSVTVMEMLYSKKERKGTISLDFFFEGQKNELFEEKILNYLEKLPSSFSWLRDYHLILDSRNTFPHSAGIASSASSMSALALCILSASQEIHGEDLDSPVFNMEASDLARQASGSACRSVYGGYTVWGRIPGVEETNDKYAIPLPGGIHNEFSDMKDAILLVSSGSKKVSSRAGHGLMNDHPFALPRYEMAVKNAALMMNALKSGDAELFIRITEQEALVLHALMMSSSDPFLLLQPNSLVLIEKIRQFRKETGLPVCFTIDAGPNIHLLYPGKEASRVSEWIMEDLAGYLENKKWISDGIGKGPVRSSN